VFARAFWGGVNGEESVHVQASGPDTPAMVDVIRSSWPEHRVSRADAREDFSDPKAWRWLSKIGLRVAEDFGLRVSTVGDWVRGKHGRTLYIGAPKSRVGVRIYEKGKQLGVDPNWVRLEVQVRPTGEGKSALCGVMPGQLMEAAVWTRELARRVGMPELQAVRVRDPWSPGDDESALRWCLRQYGAVLERKAKTIGGWEALGAWIGAQRGPGTVH